MFYEGILGSIIRDRNTLYPLKNPTPLGVGVSERHCIFDNKKLEENYTISKELQEDKEYPDYSVMPTAQSAQQTIKQAFSVWKSYLRAIKEYQKNPDKFSGKPRLPRYKEKDGFYPITFTNQNCKIRDGFITFPKSCGNFVLQFDKTKFKNFVKLSEVKIVPKQNMLIVLITYTKSIWDVCRKKPKHVLGIDMGINNLASCVDDKGEVSFIIDGRYDFRTITSPAPFGAGFFYICLAQSPVSSTKGNRLDFQSKPLIQAIRERPVSKNSETTFSTILDNT